MRFNTGLYTRWSAAILTMRLAVSRKRFPFCPRFPTGRKTGGPSPYRATWQVRSGKKASLIPASVWYRQMLPTARRFDDRFDVGFALRGLAGITAQRGDPFRALEAESESVRVFHTNGFEWQAGTGRGNLCEHFIRLGDYDAANRECAAAYLSALRFRDMSQVQSLLALRAALPTETGQRDGGSSNSAESPSFRRPCPSHNGTTGIP